MKIGHKTLDTGMPINMQRMVKKIRNRNRGKSVVDGGSATGGKSANNGKSATDGKAGPDDLVDLTDLDDPSDLDDPTDLDYSLDPLQEDLDSFPQPSSPKKKRARFSEDTKDKENQSPVLSSGGRKENKRGTVSATVTSGTGCNVSPLTITSSQIAVYAKAEQLPLQPVALNPVGPATSGEVPQDVLALVRNHQALDAQRSLASAQMVMAVLGSYTKK